MSTHINAPEGASAKTILLPGDPLRAQYIAKNFLKDVSCYNEVRNMFGYTGTYKGHRISVQGTGMGMPSIAIYVTELMKDYGCERLIRVGTCGAYGETAQLKDIILAQGACTNSAMTEHIFPGVFAPLADFSLLHRAYETAVKMQMSVKVGNVLSSDSFYESDPEVWKIWKAYGVLAVEMELAALYLIASKYGRKAMGLLSVSDHLMRGEELTAKERAESLDDMITLALESYAATEK